jgi:hypothetical protein
VLSPNAPLRHRKPNYTLYLPYTLERVRVNQVAKLIRSLKVAFPQTSLISRRWRWLRPEAAMTRNPGTVLVFQSPVNLAFLRCGFARRWLQETIQSQTSTTLLRSNQSTSFNTSSSLGDERPATVSWSEISPALRSQPAERIPYRCLIVAKRVFKSFV